jgi:hypothetical protein
VHDHLERLAYEHLGRGFNLGQELWRRGCQRWITQQRTVHQPPQNADVPITESIWPGGENLHQPNILITDPDGYGHNGANAKPAAAGQVYACVRF